MTSAPAYNVVRGVMVLEEPSNAERLEQLRLKALEMGLTADIFNHGDGPHLCVDVYDGTRHLGTLLCFFEGDEEKWRLQAACSVAASLPMQADWLVGGAKKVTDVFAALVATS